MSEKQVKIVLKLNDLVTKPLRDVEKNFQEFTNKRFAGAAQLKTSFSGISSSIKKMSDTAGVGKVAQSFGAMGSSFGEVAKQSLGLAAGAGLAVGGILALVKQTADAGDGLVNVAKRINFGVEAFQEYQYAAEQSGVSNEDFTKGLEVFTRKMGEAKNGQGQLYSFLKKSNPELLKQVMGAKSNQEAFELMTNSLGGVKDAQKQAAYSAMLFGKSGKNFTNLANEGAGGINKLRESARALGVMTEAQAMAADDFGDKWSSMERLFVGIRNTVASGLIPELHKLADTFMALVKNNQPQIQAFAKSFAEQLPGAIRQLGSVLNSLVTIVGPVIGIFAWLGDTFGWTATIIGLLSATIGKGLVIALWGAGKAVLGFGAALMTTPIGWLILGVTAIGAAIFLLYKYWGDIWGGIKSITSSVIDWILVKFDAILSKFSGLKSLLPSWLGGTTSTDVNVNNTGSVGKQAVQNFNQAQSSQNESQIKVSFDNLPKGARVDSMGSKNVETDLRMGLMATSTI